MKKRRVYLGIITFLFLAFSAGISFPTATSATYGELDDHHANPDNPYAYIPNSTLRMELAKTIGERDTFDYLNYELLSRSKLNTLTKFDTESSAYTLDSIKYLENLLVYISEDNYTTDYRPFKKLTKLEKFIQYGTPATSLDFFANMKNIEEIILELSNVTDDAGELDKTLRPIFDISVLNNLDHLESISIHADERYAETITLKKNMTHYQLVDPVILSKQFDTDLLYESNDPNFSFEDGVLTWNNLDPATTELHYSWDARSDIGSFSGQVTIPIRWK